MSQIISHSKSLDLLRFPLAVVILIVHVFNTNGITFQGITSGFEKYPLFMGGKSLYRWFLEESKCTYLLFHFWLCLFLRSKNDKGNLYP